jgi:hypothetical protein
MDRQDRPVTNLHTTQALIEVIDVDSARQLHPVINNDHKPNAT